MCRVTRVQRYAGLPEFSDMQGYQISEICRVTRFQRYAGLPDFRDMQGYQISEICRVTIVREEHL